MNMVHDSSCWWAIPLLVEQCETDLWCITSLELPLFHVVGETEENTRENARVLLKQYLERNYSVSVNRIVFADEVGTVEQVPLPAYMIAEVARTGDQPLHS